jgi:uncharacterized protein (TIRG00374 family)
MGKKLTRLLGLLILGIILWRTDIGALGESLAGCRFLPLAAASGVCVLAVVAKGLRWKLLLNAQGYSYPVHRAVMLYFSGLYIGLVTPGKLGELARSLYVKRDFNTTTGRALSALVLDRIFDLYALLVVGLLAFVHFELISGLSAIFLIFVAIAALLPLILLNPKLGRWFTRTVLSRATKKFGVASADGANGFITGTEALLSLRSLFVGVVLTVVAYVFIFGSGYLMTRSLSIGISFLDAALVLGTANLLSLIPITVAGVGTRDAVFVFAFSVLGIGQTQALAFSALVLVIFHLGMGLVGMCFFFADRPMKREEVQEPAGLP